MRITKSLYRKLEGKNKSFPLETIRDGPLRFKFINSFFPCGDIAVKANPCLCIVHVLVGKIDDQQTKYRMLHKVGIKSVKKIKQYLKEWRWMGSVDGGVLDRKVSGDLVLYQSKFRCVLGKTRVCQNYLQGKSMGNGEPSSIKC